jgi:hypothetical protein
MWFMEGGTEFAVTITVATTDGVRQRNDQDMCVDPEVETVSVEPEISWAATGVSTEPADAVPG